MPETQYARCGDLGDDIGGIGVHIGARIMAEAAPGEIMVSSTVRDLVIGSGIGFQSRGTHALKGVPGEWQLMAVVTRRAPGVVRGLSRLSSRA